MAEFGPLAGGIGSTDEADIEGRDIRFLGSDVGSDVGSALGSDDSASLGDVDDDFRQTPDVIEVSDEGSDDLEIAFERKLAELNAMLETLSSRRKREQQRDTPSQAQLRDYQKKIHETTLEILSVKREMKRAGVVGYKPTARVLVRRAPFSTHRTPESRGDTDNAARRLRLELKEANLGLSQLEASDLAALRAQDARLSGVARGASATVAASQDELRVIRDVRNQAAALISETNRATADVALASTTSQVARDAEKSGDAALALDAGRVARRATADAGRDVEFEKRTAITILGDLNRLENAAKQNVAEGRRIEAELAAESAVDEQREIDEPRAVTRIKDRQQATERARTQIAVVFPQDARFPLPGDRVGNFGDLYTATFAGSGLQSSFVLKSRPTKEDPNFVFVIAKVSRVTALLLVSTLFRGIILRWARTSGIGGPLSGHSSLATAEWTDTLVPIFTALALATKAAYYKDDGNETLVEFQNALLDSAGWIFTLALTGVTHYNSVVERNAGQRLQPPHVRRPSRFETLGVDFGAFVGQLPAVPQQTNNQLLTGDADYAGKGIANGISTPMLKMAFSLSQPRGERVGTPSAIFKEDFRSIINRRNSDGVRTVDFAALNDPHRNDVTAEKRWENPTTSSLESELSRVFMLPVFEALLGDEMRALVGTTSSYETVDGSFSKVWYENLGVINSLTVADCPPYIYDIDDTDPPRISVEWSPVNHVAEVYDLNKELTFTDADLVTIRQKFVDCVKQLKGGKTGATLKGQQTFQAATKLHFLAALAKELASSYQFLSVQNAASLHERLDMMTAIVGAAMFTPFQLSPGKNAEVKSFFARFGNRPTAEAVNAKGEIVRVSVETAHKASRHDSTKQSEFRPAFLPAALGGKSKKTLGVLLHDSKDLTTSAFRRFMAEDERIQQKLDDTEGNKQYTVLVPSTEAFGEPAAAALSGDPGALFKTIEFHIFDHELDLEKLGKEPLKRHTVFTEFAGKKLQFSVNRGFSNTKGGTIKLWNGAAVVGGGNTLAVISGAMRGKNGVAFVIDGIIDVERSDKVVPKSKESEFRPSWLPEFAGGKSKKSVGVLIQNDDSLTTSGFRRVLAEDNYIREKLEEADLGYKFTVFVPSTEALSTSEGLALMQDEDELRNTLEYHIFDEELDLEKLGKDPLKRHSVFTEFAGVPLKFSVNRGFSNTKGGTITLLNGATVLGGGRIVSVISAPRRGNNGVWYVIDDVIDGMKAGFAYQKMIAKKKQHAAELQKGTTGLGLSQAIKKTTAPIVPPPFVSTGLPPPFASTGLPPPPMPFVSSREKAKYINARITKIKEHGATLTSTVTTGSRSSATEMSAFDQSEAKDYARFVRDERRADETTEQTVERLLDEGRIDVPAKHVLQLLARLAAHRAATEMSAFDQSEAEDYARFVRDERRADETTEQTVERLLDEGRIDVPAKHVLQLLARLAAHRARPSSTKHRLPKDNAGRSRSRHLLQSMARGGTYLDSFDRHVDSFLADETGGENKDDPAVESIADQQRLVEWLRNKKEESRKTIPSSNKERNAHGQYTNTKKKSSSQQHKRGVDTSVDDDYDVAIVFKRDKLDAVDEQQGPGLLLKLLKKYHVLNEVRRYEHGVIIFAPEPSLLAVLDLSAMTSEQIETLLREHIVVPYWSPTPSDTPTHHTITPHQLKGILSGELTSHPVSLETLNGVGTSEVVLLPRTTHKPTSFDQRSSVITLKDIEPDQNTLVYEDGKERQHPVYIFMIKKVLMPTDTTETEEEEEEEVESQTKHGHHSMKTLTAAKAAKVSQGVLLAPENESRVAKETRAQQWLADLEGTTNLVKKERDAQTLLDHIDRLSKHLDRIGGADGIKKDLQRADIDRIFDKLDRAIAQNRNIDPLDKDEARQQMLDLQARFDVM